ncbi:hypothetical protein CYQ88_02210 [Hydrogenovibrio sp. SC-1]|uniref:porin n=1 Tax=Hydrogenovibrio sp. SC-1 TaxID=2065820 RepID=UPI000C7D4560|nr:porin [Hydrogenovibrio sp. SC-1]PLA75065.1 hypothetical protein CYQ88_02210 [Hydrogenovibrio sp. SC-1]
MKKNMIALAIASAVAAPAAFADAPTVYGKVNSAIQSNAKGADTGLTVDSVASRVGVKGAADLTPGLKAVYKYEFEVQMDASSTLKNRNQYLGLAGGFGTVLMGRHDTPVKMSQASDLFNDGVFDNNAMTSVMAHGEDRLSNVLAYVSPDLGGVKIIGAFVPDEGATGAAKDSSLTDTTSFAAIYGSKKKGLFLSAGVNSFGELKDAAGVVTRASATFTRVSAQYSVAGLVANAMYQTYDGAGKEGSNITANVGYHMGQFMPKIKYATNSEDKNSGNTGSVVVVGMDYKLGKKTTAYVDFGSFDKEMGANSKVGSGTADSITKYSIGLIHKF